MGRIRKGILGGFSGRVGTVVGGSWKGIAYMRSLPQKVKNPRTIGQKSQRTKFSLALALLQPLTAFLRTGWKLYAHKKSPFNAAMSYVLANVITGEYPDYSVDASKLLVSRGALIPAVNPTAEITGDNFVFSWEDNSGIGTAKPTDKALIAILNQTKGEAIIDTAGAKRSAGTQTVILPGDWAGDNVDVYLGFISEDGKEVANSVYLGCITID